MFIPFFLPDRPTHLHEREGDGKRNILLGWPEQKKKIDWVDLLFQSTSIELVQQLVHSAPEEYENAKITGHFGLVVENKSVREIT